MLRITVDQNDTSCRLNLSGRLCGLWVAEAKRAWHSSPCLERQIEIDMRELTSIDECGRELLSAMYQAGARLVVEGVWMTALIEEITGKQPIDAPMGQSRKKKVPADSCSKSRRNNK